MSFQDTLVDVIDTNATKKPDSPQFKFTNPLKKNIFVNSIQLSFDAYFSEKGAILIKINNNPILFKKAGSFKRLENFTIPMQNQEFLQQQKIEIFAWNGIDSDFVSVGYDIKISEDPDISISNDTPLLQNQRNLQISEPALLFVKKIYFNETQTTLLDMKGFKKMILTIIADNYSSGATVTVGNANLIDGDLNSLSANILVPYPASITNIGEIDFGSIASRIPQVKFKKVTNIGASETHTITLEVSNDGIGWTTVDTLVLVHDPPVDFEMSDIEQSFRHMRVRAIWTAGSTTSIHFAGYEMFDGKIFGGSLALSFEVFNLADDNFIEYISASAIGTITEGNNLRKIIGDVIDDLGSEKFNFPLPSTQTDFRAKIIITGGGLTVGISILRIQ